MIKVNNKLNLSAVSLISILSISACGGGGGTSSETPAPTPSPISTVETSIVQVEQEVLVGQSTELVLHAPDNKVSSINWKQTGGEAINFYAKNSKVVGFTPLVAGDYAFEVNFTDDAGSEQTLTYNFSVQSVQSLLTVRLGHAVIEGNDVSLISYASLNDNGEKVTPNSLQWSQIQGPTVEFTENNTNGEVAVFFDAPEIDKDTILQFKVSGSINGDIVSDDIAILVENTTTKVELNSQKTPFNDRVADVFLYNPNSTAGQQLVDCVYSNKALYATSCTLNQTPLIAHVSDAPTVEQIMDRVVVSHQWMGDQFKKFLETYDNEHNDFKNLLRATTAIVLSYDIRPSFYDPTTGAIYLDPNDLWETATQRDTINQAPDFRADFGNELQFEMPWRYVKNNEYASYYAPISYRLERSLSASLYDFSSLLYHELAHANDFFPSDSWAELQRSDTLVNIVSDLYNSKKIQSDDLQRMLPLDYGWASGEQNEMTKLGQVRFQDPNLITEEQKGYSMEDVANLFKTESAPKFYSYSSTREDYAVLFDAFMMHARYNVSRDVAVSDPNYSKVVWGQRGREGEERIKPRVKFVVERILPEYTEAANIINALPAPISFDPNKTWNENLTITQLEATNSTSVKPVLTLKRKGDTRLLPKDGESHHGSGRKFIY